MALWIYGEFSEEERAFIENRLANEVWTSVSTTNDLLDEDDKPGAYFDKGREILGYAASLLKVLGDEKGDYLRELRAAAYERRKDEESTDYYFTAEEVKTIYELIRNLPEKKKEVIDHFQEIRPEKRAFVKQVAPELFRLRDDKNAWSLYPHDQIEQLVKFFELAVKKQREIVVA